MSSNKTGETRQIATFHTHFGALEFSDRLKKRGGSPRMMPVPRALSASCGTCVAFALPFEPGLAVEDLDKVYADEDGGYRLVYDHEE